MLLQIATVPEITVISPCLKSLLSEVPNTSTPGPTPVAFNRVIVDIFGAVDITPLQDAFTPFLGARHFHEEQERCFPCVLSDFRLWFGHFHRDSLSLGQPHCYHNYDPVYELFSLPASVRHKTKPMRYQRDVPSINFWIIALHEVGRFDRTRFFSGDKEVS